MNTSYIILAVIGVLILAFIIILLLKRSKGKIEIQLGSYNYSPGAAIEGVVKINLKKEVNVKSVDLRLYGERSQKSYNIVAAGSSRQSSRETQVTRVFDFSQPIGEGGVFAPGEKEFKFSINVPSASAINSTRNPAVDMIVKTVQIMGEVPAPIRWYLEARLNCDGLDLTKRVQINIA
jgi:hypothetical protein